MTQEEIAQLNGVRESLRASLKMVDDLIPAPPPIDSLPENPKKEEHTARLTLKTNDDWDVVTTASTLGTQSLMDKASTLGVQPSGFKLGANSKKELLGVKKELVDCVMLAIDITTQDFMVFDGIRTIQEQRKHVANGMSQTMKSKHLDGLAVDLVPWVDGKPVWDWNRIYPIAYAMDKAATHLRVANHIRWGGAWDRVLSDFGGSERAYKDECANYIRRHPGKDFIDGPHFEWVN